MSTDLAIPGGSWGSEQATSKDMLIPRLQLQQDLSDQVKKGKARPGMIINSATGAVVAEVDKPIEIIPILTFGEWLIYDVVEERGKQKEVYRTKIIVTKENENWKNEEVEFGKLIRRVRQINFLTLLPAFLEDLPFMVQFRKTTMMAGRKLSTHFQVSAMKGYPAAKQVFNLSSIAMTRNSFNFYGFEVEQGRATSQEELAKAYHWYQLFNQGVVKAEEELAEAPTFP